MLTSFNLKFLGVLCLISLLLSSNCAFAQVASVSKAAEADNFQDLLAKKDGVEFIHGGKTYIWQNGVPHEKLADGSLAPIEMPEDEELYTVEDGQHWLSQGADGTIYITVAPKVWAHINFQYDSDILTEEAKTMLAVFGEHLNSSGLKNHRLIIAGHTDNQGLYNYNVELSKRRALSVAKHLSEVYSLAPGRLILTGYGPSKPISSNDSPEGQAENRRVEFILLSPPKDLGE